MFSSPGSLSWDCFWDHLSSFTWEGSPWTPDYLAERLCMSETPTVLEPPEPRPEWRRRPSAGCFWCNEAVFQQLKGVQSVVSGYSGGSVKNPTYRQLRGRILWSLQRYDEVVANSDIALQLDPGDGDPLAGKAWALLRLGRPVEAEVVARALLEYREHAGEAWLLVSHSLSAQGKNRAALAGIRRALRSDPVNVRYLCCCGNILADLDRYEDVVANENLLLSIDSTHSHSLLMKGVALVQLRRYAEAEIVACEYVKREPRKPTGPVLVCYAKAGAQGLRAGAEYLAASFDVIGNARHGGSITEITLFLTNPHQNAPKLKSPGAPPRAAGIADDQRVAGVLGGFGANYAVRQGLEWSHHVGGRGVYWQRGPCVRRRRQY